MFCKINPKRKMSTFKAVREEEDDSAFSRQVTLQWSIPHFSNVLARIKPKQRLKSPPFRIYNCAGFDVEGSIIFFPRGASAALSDGVVHPEPTLGLELMHAVRDPDPDLPLSKKLGKQKKRHPTPVAIEVEFFTDDPTDGADDSQGTSVSVYGVALAGCTEIEIMKRPVVPRWTLDQNEGSDRGADDEEKSPSRSNAPMKASPEDTIEIAGAVTSQDFARIHQSLCIVIKITFLSHADDLSDASDSDDDVTRDEDRTNDGLGRLFHSPPFGKKSGGSKATSEATALFSQVLHKGQGFLGNILTGSSAISGNQQDSSESVNADTVNSETSEKASVMKSAASAASAAVAGVAAELFQRHQSDVDFSMEWQPLVLVYCSSEGEPPNRWRSVGAGVWCVFVHCLCDLDGTFLTGATVDWNDATEAWSRPAPSAVTAVSEWCPPVRQRLAELVPHQTTIKKFWVSFLSALDRVTRFDPKTESERILLELVSIAQGTTSDSSLAPLDALQQISATERNKVVDSMQLLNFSIRADDFDNVDMPASVLTRSDVEHQLEYVRSAMALLEKRHRENSFSGDAHISAEHTDELVHMVQKLRSIHDVWKMAEKSSLATHHAVVQKARGICEHSTWSLLARRTLAAAGERGVSGISEICDSMAMIVEAAEGLLEAHA